MNSPIIQLTRQIGRAARRLVRWEAIGWFVCIVGLTAVLAGSLDYCLRLQDPGILWLFSLGLWAVAAATFVRFVMRAWRFRCSEVEAAQHIELLHPHLQDRLSSAVSFALQDEHDDLAGSLDLRRLVIDQAEREARELRASHCLNSGRAWRALTCAGSVAAVILILTWCDSASVGLAARRLVRPWSAAPWPRRNNLQIVEAPKRLVAGMGFELKIIDRTDGRLARVEIDIQDIAAGDEGSDTFQAQPMGTRWIYRHENVRNSFRFRARGGDDQNMPWRIVEVIEAPRVIERTLRLHRPEYTRLAPVEATPSFQAIAGTIVEMHLRCDRPIDQATLITDTIDPPAEITLALDRDRRGFHLPATGPSTWAIQRSGTYQVRLVDKLGMESGADHQWHVRVIPDESPSVAIQHPAVDRSVTATATVQLECLAKDDLALRDVVLYWKQSGNGDRPPESLSLWSDSESPFDPGSTKDPIGGVQRVIRWNWQLAQLPDLVEGSSIDLYLEASDFLGQTGRSAIRRLSIISADELVDQVGQKQSTILEQIAEVTRLQRGALSQTRELVIQLESTGRFRRREVDQQQTDELNQRDIQNSLWDPRTGIERQVGNILIDMDNNRIEQRQLVDRLQRIREALTELNKRVVPEIERQLNDSLKLARQAVNDMGPSTAGELSLSHLRLLRQGLESVTPLQQQALESLEQMVEELARWDDSRRLAREVSQLRRRQLELQQRTDRLQSATIGKNLQGLSSDERASLKRLVERQTDLVRQFDSVRHRIDTSRQQTTRRDPAMTRLLDNALDAIRQAGTAGTLRDAVQNLRNNQLGRATDLQADVARQLEHLQDVLANRREFQLDRLAEQLAGLSRQIGDLRDRQEAVRASVDGQPTLTDEQFRQYAREETDLANRVKQLLRTVEQMPNSPAGGHLQAAAASLEQAAEEARQRRRPELASQANEAKESLDRAEQSVERAARRAAGNLQRERMEQMQRVLREVADEQKRVLAESRAVGQWRRATGGELDADHRSQLRSLADRESMLAQNVAAQRQDNGDVPALRMALEEIGGRLSEAAARLQREQIDQETEQLEQAALEQLQAILSALAGRPNEPTAGENGSPPDDTQEDNGSPKNRYLLAQLKILRAMQSEINAQTRLLDRQVGSTVSWSIEQERRREDISRRQSTLAGVLLKLLGEAPDKRPVEDSAQPTEDALESLERALGNGKL